MNWYSLYKKHKEENPDDELIEQLSRPKWTNIDSSFIDAVAYSKLARVLEVRMKNGQIYTFVGIPESIFQGFLNSESKGNYFNTVIRKNYTTR